MKKKRSLVVLPATIAFYSAMPTDAFAAVLETAAQTPSNVDTGSGFSASEAAAIASGPLDDPLFYVILMLIGLLLVSWGFVIAATVRYSQLKTKICNDYRCVKNPLTAEAAEGYDFRTIETPKEFLCYEAQSSIGLMESIGVSIKPAVQSLKASAMNLASNFGYNMTATPDPFNRVTMDLTSDMLQQVLEGIQQDALARQEMQAQADQLPLQAQVEPRLPVQPPAPRWTMAEQRVSVRTHVQRWTQAVPKLPALLNPQVQIQEEVTLPELPHIPIQEQIEAAVPVLPKAQLQRQLEAKAWMKLPTTVKTRPHTLTRQIAQEPETTYRGKHFRKGVTEASHKASHLQAVPTMKHARSNVDQAIERVIEQASRRIS